MSRTSSIVAREQWGEIVRRQRASGLSVAAFCRREGLAASSLFAWKRRLGRAGATAAFVEAKLAPSGPSSHNGDSHTTPTDADVIELRLRGRRVLRVGRGFDLALLADLVRTLEALP